jgi:hypothetical protein
MAVRLRPSPTSSSACLEAWLWQVPAAHPVSTAPPMTYFVGNVVNGGRQAFQGDWDFSWWLTDAAQIRPSHYVFSGNTVTLLPAWEYYDYPGAALTFRTSSRGNISGNTLLGAGHAVRWRGSCTNAIVLKNNFAAAYPRALVYDDSDHVAQNFQILKNILGHGSSYHLKINHADSDKFFLWKNIYTNGVSAVDPFLDPASAPVHFIR